MIPQFFPHGAQGFGQFELQIISNKLYFLIKHRPGIETVDVSIEEPQYHFLRFGIGRQKTLPGKDRIGFPLVSLVIDQDSLHFFPLDGNFLDIDDQAVEQVIKNPFLDLNISLRLGDLIKGGSKPAVSPREPIKDTKRSEEVSSNGENGDRKKELI